MASIIVTVRPAWTFMNDVLICATSTIHHEEWYTWGAWTIWHRREHENNAWKWGEVHDKPRSFYRDRILSKNRIYNQDYAVVQPYNFSNDVCDSFRGMLLGALSIFGWTTEGCKFEFQTRVRHRVPTVPESNIAESIVEKRGSSLSRRGRRDASRSTDSTMTGNERNGLRKYPSPLLKTVGWINKWTLVYALYTSRFRESSRGSARKFARLVAKNF